MAFAHWNGEICMKNINLAKNTICIYLQIKLISVAFLCAVHGFSTTMYYYSHFTKPNNHCKMSSSWRWLLNVNHSYKEVKIRFSFHFLFCIRKRHRQKQTRNATNATKYSKVNICNPDFVWTNWRALLFLLSRLLLLWGWVLIKLQKAI